MTNKNRKQEMGIHNASPVVPVSPCIPLYQQHRVVNKKLQLRATSYLFLFEKNHYKARLKVIVLAQSGRGWLLLIICATGRQRREYPLIMECSWFVIKAIIIAIALAGYVYSAQWEKKCNRLSNKVVIKSIYLQSNILVYYFI